MSLKNIWEMGPENPYLAIDGSDHWDMEGVRQANDEFWENTLSDKFDNSGETDDFYQKEIKTIFESAYNLLYISGVRFELWEVIFAAFYKGVENGLFSDEFIRVISKEFLNSIGNVGISDPKQDDLLKKYQGLLLEVQERFTFGGR